MFKMELQEEQKWIQKYMDLAKLQTLENLWASTLMKDGEPILCAGPIVCGDHRAILWSVLSNKVNKFNFLVIHLLSKEYIANLPFRRLETVVECKFKEGHRWMAALGFEMEAPRMKAFQEDGRDCSLYALVRD